MSGIAAEPIACNRIDLLPLRIEHAEEMAVVLSDPSLHTFIGGEPLSPQALDARYRRLVAGSPDPAISWCNWVIQIRDEACLAGTVQATIGPSGEDLIAEVAWVVGAPWQGRGLATEAVRGLVGWLRHQPIQMVIAHIHPDHRPSAAVASSAGLVATEHWHDGEVRWETYHRP